LEQVITGLGYDVASYFNLLLNDLVDRYRVRQQDDLVKENEGIITLKTTEVKNKIKIKAGK
jgi:hypothetical protein